MRFATPLRLLWAVTALICGCELATILILTHGHVLYSQDDPYIHLALAERLNNSFHYGLNTGEPASPASSILYPFLLALGLRLGLGAASALVACIAATVIGCKLLCDILQESGYRLDDLPALTWTATGMVLLLGCNWIGVAFTGMEHSLHIMLMLGGLLGLHRFCRDGRVRSVWMLSVGLCPLVRYEGVSLWLPTVAFLLWHHRWKEAIGLFAGTSAGLAAFSFWLLEHGLPALPSSVLTKGHGAGFGGTASIHNLSAFLHTHFALVAMAPGFGLLCGTTLVCAGATSIAFRDRLHAAAWVGAFASVTGAAHIAIGTFGNVGRYEAYAVTATVVGTIVAAGARLAPWISRARPAQMAIGIAALFLALNVNASLAVNTPLAARNVYDQPYQLHRFVRDFWRRPVGVNDIGEVSFGNQHYVLDLAGLASEEVRQARLHASGTEWMDAVVREHGVGLVMIFPDWFPIVPGAWKRLGSMTLAGPRVVVGGSVVAFYATNSHSVTELQSMLPGFVLGLPADETFQPN